MQTQEEELKHLLLGAELDLLDRIEERCADLEARVGDDASLRGSLRSVIVDVLRDAGVQDYERLATVLAPDRAGEHPRRNQEFARSDGRRAVPDHRPACRGPRFAMRFAS